MTETKHTPGPWDCEEFVVTADDVGEPCYAYFSDGERIPTTKANARLIAAAPELLEALELMRRVGDDKFSLRTEWVKAVEQVDAAIAKARGHD